MSQQQTYHPFCSNANGAICRIGKKIAFAIAENAAKFAIMICNVINVKKLADSQQQQQHHYHLKEKFQNVHKK